MLDPILTLTNICYQLLWTCVLEVSVAHTLNLHTVKYQSQYCCCIISGTELYSYQSFDVHS